MENFYLELQINITTYGGVVHKSLLHGLTLELNSATIEKQIDSYLTSLNDELRHELTESAQGRAIALKLMGFDIN